MRRRLNINNFVLDSHVDAFFYFWNWLSVINFSQSSSLHQLPDVLHSVVCVPRPFSFFHFNVRLPLYLPSFKKWAGLIPPPLLMWQISSNDSAVAPGSSHWKHEPPLSLFFTPFSHSRTFSRPLHSLFKPIWIFRGGVLLFCRTRPLENKKEDCLGLDHFPPWRQWQTLCTADGCHVDDAVIRQAFNSRYCDIPCLTPQKLSWEACPTQAAALWWLLLLLFFDFSAPVATFSPNRRGWAGGQRFSVRLGAVCTVLEIVVYFQLILYELRLQLMCQATSEALTLYVWKRLVSSCCLAR